jgi:hypothetical protein
MHNITKAIKNAFCSIKKFTKRVSLKGGYISSSASASVTRRNKRRKARTWRVAKKPIKTKNMKSRRRKRKTKGKK